MSRSIHTTYNEYRRERRFDYADAEARRERLEALRKEGARKRRIKGRVREERDRLALDLPPVLAEAVPIEVCDQGPFVVHPASPADLRAVMGRLPPGTLDGLSGVRLCLGKEYQEEELPPDERKSAERDPWVSRVGYENVPGVFGGRILGSYWHDPNRIDLYAYVVDPDLLNRPMWELFFRLRVLSTFVHEVAHHQDRMLRVARGRWRMDDKEKNEEYATAVQARWVKDVVVPYLHEAYPSEVTALDCWLTHHGGTSLPLALLAGGWRWDEDGQCHPVYFGSAREAFEELAREVHKGETQTEARLGFAEFLHYGENYEESLRCIDRVLEGEPENLKALTLRADVFEHQGKYPLAEALARRVLTHDVGYVDAWMVLADVHEAGGAWQELTTASTHGMEAADPEDWRYRRLLDQRARALLELGRYDDLQADLNLLASDGWRGQRDADALRALMLLRTGGAEEALRLARACLEDVGGKHRPLFRAVCFEAAHLLGRPAEAGELSPDDLGVLRRTHHGAWVDRLVALAGLSEAED